MQINYRALAQHYRWWADVPGQTNRLIASDLQPWVTDRGSLTSALVGLSNNNFKVRVRRQGITTPLFHEQLKLARPLQRAAMIREVELTIFDQPVVFARSIVPLSLVSNGKNGLSNLGRTPLGHLLFKDGRIRVSKREFATIETAAATITARRTPYDYQGSTILVAEFFLPSFQNYIR